ncbi:hypothetical protein [Saccharopolyspora spinosa]|uniref:hypothetical protein n=1 Tax=Saccharopolyspora spinosa TaxID=60894 RepID=UPI00023792C6|nr:hypothetical protein [Saccharopolyspora spinosa]
MLFIKEFRAFLNKPVLRLGSGKARSVRVDLVTIPKAQSAPTVDGVDDDGEHTSPELDLSSLWEGTLAWS